MRRPRVPSRGSTEKISTASRSKFKWRWLRPRPTCEAEAAAVFVAETAAAFEEETAEVEAVAFEAETAEEVVSAAETEMADSTEEIEAAEAVFEVTTEVGAVVVVVAAARKGLEIGTAPTRRAATITFPGERIATSATPTDLKVPEMVVAAEAVGVAVVDLEEVIAEVDLAGEIAEVDSEEEIEEAKTEIAIEEVAEVDLVAVPCETAGTGVTVTGRTKTSCCFASKTFFLKSKRLNNLQYSN